MNKRMGRGQFLAWGTAAVLILTSTACMPGQAGRPPETESKVPANDQSISAENVETREEPLAVSYTGKADLEEEPMKESNILIAYFTWAENTLSDGQVDASSSASVLLPGNVGQMAAWVRQETGGDLFSIRTKEPYPSDYDECLERAIGEKAEEARPALNGQVAHIEEYDTVFIGFPDWLAYHNLIQCTQV